MASIFLLKRAYSNFLFTILASILACMLTLIISSCVPRSTEYRIFYDHLNRIGLTTQNKMKESDYFLVILVDARHLDYTEGEKFFHSVAKHPCGGAKNGDVGHAWIYLQGISEGKVVAFEGGHSGERQEPPVRYFDGVMNYHDWGYANPTSYQISHPRYEANPIKYLWTERLDGFCQRGSGRHHPTYAAKIDLTKEQFDKLWEFVLHYPYRYYGLMGPQCSTFASQAAKIGGISLKSHLSMKVASSAFFGGVQIRLWKDPYYSVFYVPTPDMLEKSLIEAVERGEAEYALQWYFERCKKD